MSSFASLSTTCWSGYKLLTSSPVPCLPDIFDIAYNEVCGLTLWTLTKFSVKMFPFKVGMEFHYSNRTVNKEQYLFWCGYLVLNRILWSWKNVILDHFLVRTSHIL